jgi:hypothetical protein
MAKCGRNMSRINKVSTTNHTRESHYLYTRRYNMFKVLFRDSEVVMETEYLHGGGGRGGTTWGRSQHSNHYRAHREPRLSKTALSCVLVSQPCWLQPFRIPNLHSMPCLTGHWQNMWYLDSSSCQPFLRVALSENPLSCRCRLSIWYPRPVSICISNRRKEVSTWS